jgi:predicted ATPase
MSNVFEQLKNLPDNQRQPYITHMRFPFYKNLTSDARIDFKYPITAIVGMNGSSKSSILRAVYGAPQGRDISDYWFESKLDYINDGVTENEEHENEQHVNKSAPSSFIYGYFNALANRNVEVLKTRVRKKSQTDDYWETAKPQKKYKMEPMPSITEVPVDDARNETRWKPIDKKVVYLDFRHEAVSAFDKFFYNGAFIPTPKIKSKQDFIRTRTRLIKKVIAGDLQEISWHRLPRVKQNFLIPDDQRSKICEILGKNYSQIRIIEHSFFTESFEKTIYLSCDDLQYSEAFAGSGEFAVISLVTAVMSASEKSLILLDEPEVSVHPGAQEKLLKFLADEALSKKHQIVFTTHSQPMIKNLPKEAIHVLYEDSNGRINIRSDVHPAEAFAAIGADFEKKTIIVEDKVARKLVEHILKDYNISDQFDVKESPNGVDWIITRSIVDSAMFDKTNVIYLLDGDKHKDHINPQTIPQSEEAALDDKIKEQTGCNIIIPHIANNNDDKVANQRRFLQFYKDKVFYFPTANPEDIIWEAVPDEDKNRINATDSKECFAQLTRQTYDHDTAHYILATQERYIHKIDSKNTAHCQDIHRIIDQFLSQ